MKPKTGGPMPRYTQPANDENDSYLKPGMKDVDDKKMAKKQAIMKRLGK
jgi:hypothetical protein